jgi:hypothetical protein
MDECGTVTYDEQIQWSLKSRVYKFDDINTVHFGYTYSVFYEPCITWLSVLMDFSSVISKYTMLDTLLVSDIKYQQVYNFYEFYVTDSIPTQLKSIFFHKKYGVIKYQLKNDETWELLKYIKR